MEKLYYIIPHEAAAFDLNKRKLGARGVRFNFKSNYCSKEKLKQKECQALQDVIDVVVE